MFGSIDGDQHPPGQRTVRTAERVEYPLLRDRFEEQRIEHLRRGTVEHQADIRVGWVRGHTEQGLAIRPAMSFLQRALMAQKRGGASHEEHRERGETDVGHGVFAGAAQRFAPVGKALCVREVAAQIGSIPQGALEDEHGSVWTDV